MPARYDQDTRATAIGLVREHAGDYPSEHAAIAAAARRPGMTPETPRKRARDEDRCRILSVMAHGHLMLAVIPGRRAIAARDGVANRGNSGTPAAVTEDDGGADKRRPAVMVG